VHGTADASGVPASIFYYGADGSICMTQDFTVSSDTVVDTYTDAHGNVFTITANASRPNTETITCGDMSTTVDVQVCGACAPGAYTGSCTDGMCTVP
jgi:hypothetical protein